MKRFNNILRVLSKNVKGNNLQDFILILLGTAVQALSLRIFLIPSLLVSGGVSGLSQIINFYTDWPIGLMVFLGNIPLFILGWRFLGGPRFILRTAFAVAVYSFFVDIPLGFLPAEGITDDLILNALYGGILSGIGFGFVYRGRGTSGGSDILARILSNWRSIPISQSYLMTDAIIILLAGFAFGWEKALYALVMLYVSGIAAETITQGSNVVRTVMIITSRPEIIKDEIFARLARGVTMVEGTGGFTGEKKTILYCVITRTEITQLKSITRDLDPKAFMVIEKAHEVRGEGFLSMVDEN